MKISIFSILCLMTIVLVLSLTGLSLIAIIGILLVVIVAYRLITVKNDALPIGLISLLISGLQWIVAPILSYQAKDGILYPMAVPENEYLLKTLILYLPFYISILYFSYREKCLLKKEELIQFCSAHIKKIIVLILIGFLASIFPAHNTSLSFILTLTENLLYIGAIMLCFAKPGHSVTICCFFLGYLLLRSILGGMFHDLMIWGLFSLLVVFSLKEYSIHRKLVIVIGLLICVSTLQIIKPIYRNYTWWGSYDGNKVELFVDLFVKSVAGELKADGSMALTGRLNQGWIISRIYERIPDEQPFVKGRTIFEGVEAALMPRFIFPDKKNSGQDSIKDFEIFTGYRLNSSTSMGLSILGEAYGNFGLIGGAFFMFLWGYLINKLISFIIYLNKKYGYWYFFTPLICFNLIKAEINFISVLNWTVKSFIYAAVIIWLLKVFYNNVGIIQTAETRKR